MDYPKLFSNHVFEVMELRGLTRTDLATLSGVTPTLFTHLAKGTASPSLKTMQSLSEGLGVPLSIMLQPSESEAWQTVVALLSMSPTKPSDNSIPEGYGRLDRGGILDKHKLSIVQEWLKNTNKELRMLKK